MYLNFTAVGQLTDSDQLCVFQFTTPQIIYTEIISLIQIIV